MLRMLMILTTLFIPMLALTADDSKCRKVPRSVGMEKKVFECDFNRETATLTCTASPNSDSSVQVTHINTYQYPDVNAFVREADIGAVQATSSRMTTQLPGMDDISQNTTYEYEENRLSGIIAEGMAGKPFQTTFAAWDKKGRPTKGKSKPAACYGSGSTIGMYEDVPVTIEYDDTARKRTTIHYFNKGRPIGSKIKCKTLVEKKVVSYDSIMGETNTATASFTEICTD